MWPALLFHAIYINFLHKTNIDGRLVYQLIFIADVYVKLIKKYLSI